MRCVHCQGRMMRGTAPFQIDRNGYHLTLDSVPAWVCSQCGEAHFEQEQVEEIQEMIESVDLGPRKLSA